MGIIISLSRSHHHLSIQVSVVEDVSLRRPKTLPRIFKILKSSKMDDDKILLSRILSRYPKASYRIFSFAGSNACGRCVSLERRLYSTLFHSSSYWHALSIALAKEKKLFLPDSNKSTDWKEVFAEHLYPARFKWTFNDDEEERRQDFKIRVSARFRPRDRTERSSKSFFVPLHQRIRLRRLNRKNLSRADIWKQDTTSDEMRRLFSNGQKLSPEVMEALAAAGELSGIASRAKTRSNDLPSWNGDDSTDNGDKESNESPTTRPTTTRPTATTTRTRALLLPHLSSSQGYHDDDQENKQIPDEKDDIPNTQQRKRKDCRVIAVDSKHSCCALYVVFIISLYKYYHRMFYEN